MGRIITVTKLAISLMTIINAVAGSAAYAQHHGHDVFRTTTAPPTNAQPHISGNAAFSINGPVPRWFDAIDAEVGARLPTIAEQAVMRRPFSGDVNRVMEWTNTASKVAQRYRAIARILRNAPMPQGLGSASENFKQYKVITADWYDDSAALFEDWIRPRKAASTREELQTQLDEMSRRAKDLDAQNNTLLTMDKELRTQFGVRDRVDALARYVTKKPQ